MYKPDAEGRVEIRKYLAFLRRRWWLLLFGPVLAGFAAVMITGRMPKTYSATSTVLVNKTTAAGSQEYYDALLSQQLTNTYAQLVTRPVVLDEVQRRLNTKLDRARLTKMITAMPVKDTQLINIGVKDSDPLLTANIANTLAQVFMDDNAGQFAATGSIKLAKAAEVPKSPISPSLPMNLTLAIVLGLVVAGGLAFLLEYVDDTIKSPSDAETESGLPVLASVERFKQNGNIFESGPQSRPAESYRQLRTNIRFASYGSDMKTIVVTSANVDEGKSTTATNLAIVLAQAGESVILVDTDLRRYAPQRQPGSPTIGLTGLLLEDVADPNLALMNTRWPHLKLLPSGILPPNPSELLTSDKMIKVIDQLKSMADYVIFDTPPTLAVTDAVILAARTDGTIIVTAAGKTRTEQLRETIRLMRQANARMIGIVLNRAAGAHAPYYYKRGEKPEIVQSVADTSTRVKARKGKRGHMVEAAVPLPQRVSLTDLAPLAGSPVIQQPARVAIEEKPAVVQQPAAQATRVIDTPRLVEEVARITEQRPIEQPRPVEVAAHVQPAPRVVEQSRPVEVARPAASLRPEPTPEEQQKRAAVLWQALVNKRTEEEQAPAALAPAPVSQAPRQEPVRIATPPHSVAPEPCPIPTESVRTITSPAARPEPVAVAPAAPRLDAGLEDKLAELQARLSGLRTATSSAALPSNGNGHHNTESPVERSHGAA